MSDLLEPVADGVSDKCFISKSYDATSHFETAANDILSLYKRITGTGECLYGYYMQIYTTYCNGVNLYYNSMSRAGYEYLCGF